MRGPAAGDDSDEEGESRGRAKGYAGLRRGPVGNQEAKPLRSSAWRPCAMTGRRLRRSCSARFLRAFFAMNRPPPSRSVSVQSSASCARAGRWIPASCTGNIFESPWKPTPGPHRRTPAPPPSSRRRKRSGMIRYVMTTEGPQPGVETHGAARLRALRAETDPPDHPFTGALHRAFHGYSLCRGWAAGAVLSHPWLSWTARLPFLATMVVDCVSVRKRTGHVDVRGQAKSPVEGNV